MSDPTRRKWACAGCRFGTRIVDLVVVYPDSEDGEDWKNPKTREQEAFYCIHERVKDPTDSSNVIVNRVFCGFREEGPRAGA